MVVVGIQDVVVVEAKSNEGCAVLIYARSHASSSRTLQSLGFHKLKYLWPRFTRLKQSEMEVRTK